MPPIPKQYIILIRNWKKNTKKNTMKYKELSSLKVNTRSMININEYVGKNKKKT